MKILILGGNGMIGHKMYQILSKEFSDTWVLFRRNFDEIASNYIYNNQKIIDNLDLLNFTKLIELLDNLQPDVIINAVGITIRRGVNDDVFRSIMINSALPHLIDNWVCTNNKRLIHFSTDCVFSGKSGNYFENSTLDAIDLYGKTKGLGEVNSAHSLTLRGSMIGRELENKTELLEWFLNQRELTIRGYSNVIYSGVTTVRMANYVRDIIRNYKNLHGIYNVSSLSISKFELVNLFNTYYKKNVTILNDDNYKSNKDLDSSRFFEVTKFEKPNWNDLLLELLQDSKLNSEIY